MTNEHHPPAHSDEPSDDVDATFAELAASIPELAALRVPADLAPLIRREFAPDRITAMTDAVSAMIAQRLPLDE